MSAMSDYLETRILNLTLRGTAFTAPSTANLRIALYTTNPTDSDTGIEVSGGGYARQPITFAAPSQVAGKAQVSNSNEITFNVATANWGQISHFGIRDANTGGNLLYYGAVSNPRSILTGDRLILQVGDIKVNLD